ncbi:MAG: chitobiase/beta-hexosaminidase C-terminal domain-containing protein, partial [Bacteroidales bacterium]|nr:chitobiase/beta-hexosaminidase C-terminal domain-containing protein [Bacteroidales bacterium]
GKNVGVGLSISDPENPESQGWMYYYPASVYYTVDGTTVPSKEAYEAQADKENGAIKMVATQMDEDGYLMTDSYGNALAVVFSENTHFKAIGYMTMEGMEIVTPVFDQEITVKALANPTFSLADYTKVKVGDKLVIKNPAPAPVEDEEGEEGDNEFGGNPGEEETAAPVGTLYFSFDGTKPTADDYQKQEADWNLEKPYSTYKIFKAEGVDVEITFGQDEQGYYAYVPAITEELYMPGYDTIRLGENGYFNVDVWAVAAEQIDDPMAWMPKFFSYGSDFVNGAYTLKDDFTVAAPTFDPEAGEVEKGTKLELASATENAKIYYTVDDSEPTAESTLYEEAIEIDEAMTVKAIAIRGDFKSEVKEAAYTIAIKPELPEVVEAPVFVPAAGKVEKGTEVTWTWNEEYDYDVMGVVYVANGKDEDLNVDAAKFEELVAAWGEEEEDLVREDGKVYLYYEGEGAYKIEKDATLKARLVLGIMKDVEEGQEGENPGMEIALSPVVTAAYTVEVANEGEEELAGVSVYPNPTSGLFNLELPVAATVEVFASNGVLVQRMTLGEGNATLNIERSGIYFLRITGEGRTTVKRLIVR